MKVTRNFKQRAIGILTGLMFNAYSDLEALRAVLQAFLDEVDRELSKAEK